MMQVTGNNKLSSSRACELILSIQLLQDGLYFSAASGKGNPLASGCIKMDGAHKKGRVHESLAALYAQNEFLSYDYQKVNLVVATPRVTAVPHEWVDDDNYGDWLTYAGFLAMPDENVVVARTDDQMALVMPMDKACDDFMREVYADKLNYVHSMQVLRSNCESKSYVAVSLEGENVYIVAVENGKAKCLLPLMYKGEAETVFCLRKIAAEFSDVPKLFFVTEDAQLAKMFAGQFKGAISLNKNLGAVAQFNVNNCRL